MNIQKEKRVSIYSQEKVVYLTHAVYYNSIAKVRLGVARLGFGVSWQIVRGLHLGGSPSGHPPLAAIQLPRHRLGQLPPLLPLLLLQDVVLSFACPDLPELLAELLAKSDVLVSLVFSLALLVLVLVLGVVKVRVIVIVAIFDEAISFRRLEADGALVAGFVPGLCARVCDATGDAEDGKKGKRKEEQHHDAKGDEVFVHCVCSLRE